MLKIAHKRLTSLDGQTYSEGGIASVSAFLAEVAQVALAPWSIIHSIPFLDSKSDVVHARFALDGQIRGIVGGNFI